MSALEEVQKANLTAVQSGNSSLSNISESLDSITSLDGINTGAKGGFLGIGADAGVKLVGMNTDDASIKRIVDGIKGYTTAIKIDLQELGRLETAGAGFGPEVGAKVQEFTTSMKDACLSIVSQLDRFCDDVKTVAATYRAKGESVISAVGSTTSAVTDAASSTKYEFENGSN